MFKIEDNRVKNLFEKYKDNKVRFKLIILLIASSVVNDREKIFLQTTGLKSAKYALLNEEYKQIIGIVSLNQIENWNTLKQGSKWVDITFQEQKILNILCLVLFQTTKRMCLVFHLSLLTLIKK